MQADDPGDRLEATRLAASLSRPARLEPPSEQRVQAIDLRSPGSELASRSRFQIDAERPAAGEGAGSGFELVFTGIVVEDATNW
jgi:hypothetical protein